ncbi:MAG: glycosyltransferase family 39 protein [Bacteroidota bacterium]
MTKKTLTSLFDNHLFSGLVAVAVLGILLTSNDILSIWNGAEAEGLLLVQEGGQLPGLYHWLLSLVYINAGLNPFLLRLLSVLGLLAAFGGFWQWGRKLFGENTVLTTLIIMGSSILLTCSAKQATGDSWLFACQLLNFLFLLRLLKSPALPWTIAFWATALLGALIQPLSMLIWSAGSWFYLYFLHPKGKALPYSWGWLPFTGLIALLVFTGQLDWKASTFLFGYGASNSFGKYLLYQLFGSLPWLPFLPVAFRDLWVKRRKGEELSLFTSGWLLMGLLSQSLILQAAFAFIMAKQVLNCFDQRYPYFTMAKLFLTFFMVLSFFGVMLLLLGSHNLFEASGFRAAVLVGGGYWALYFVSSLGMLMKNERLLIGGLAFCGLVLGAFFWAKYGPLIEQRRDLPQRIVAAGEKLVAQPSQVTLIVQKNLLPQRSNFQLMAQESLTGLRTGLSKDSLSLMIQQQDDILLLTDSLTYEMVKTNVPALRSQELKGSYKVLDDPKSYWIVGPAGD